MLAGDLYWSPDLPRLQRRGHSAPAVLPTRRGQDQRAFAYPTNRLNFRGTARVLPADEERFDQTLLLGLDLVRAVELEVLFQPLGGRRRYEHAVGLAGGLDARGDVDRVPPHVVGELSRADHARHD